MSMSDKRTDFLIRYAHDFAPFIVARASGSWIETTAGQRILDFTSGQICSTIGHNHPQLVAAVQRSLEEVIHLNSWMLSEPVLALAERLVRLVGSPLDKVILVNTGGEANEVASLNLAGGHAGYGPIMPGTFTLPAPYAYRCPIRHCSGVCDCSCLEAGFDVIDQQSVRSLCAVIAEPVLSAGGVIVPPPDYFQRLRALCDDREMLLILDEAQTGFGRLGTMFGFEWYGIEPDILTVSKTLGGGIPIAATLTTSAIEAACYNKGFMHVTSHVSDPLPAVAGLAVIEVIEEERLVEQAKQRGEYLLARLQDLQERHEQIGDVRGKGLLVGIELVEDRVKKTPADTLAMAVSDECMRCGLSMNIVRSVGGMLNCFRMAPPLSVTEQEIDIAIEIIDAALKTILASHVPHSSQYSHLERKSDEHLPSR